MSRLARIHSRVMRLRTLITLSIDMLACEETEGKQRGPLQPQSKRRSGCT